MAHLHACRYLWMIFAAAAAVVEAESMLSKGAGPMRSLALNSTGFYSSTSKPSSARTRPVARVSIVLLDGNTTHGRNGTELSGYFTPVGTVAEAAGYLRQVRITRVRHRRSVTARDSCCT